MVEGLFPSFCKGIPPPFVACSGGTGAFRSICRGLGERSARRGRGEMGFEAWCPVVDGWLGVFIRSGGLRFGTGEIEGRDKYC